MTTTRKSNFIYNLYAYKGGKPKPEQAKVTRADTSYDNVNKAQFGSDFGTGTSQKVGDTLQTTSSLADYLKPSATSAGTTLQNNLNYLNQSPGQSYQDAMSGNNPYFNVANDKLNRDTQTALGRSLVDNHSTGTTNSTTAGAAQGMILNDQIRNRNEALMNALNWGNQTATGNVNTGLNTIGSLSNLTVPLGSAANSNLMSAFNAKDASTAQYTNLLNQEAQRYAQAMDAYNLDKYNNGWAGSIAKISPVAGYALGRPDIATNTLQNYISAAGGMAGMGGLGGGGTYQPTTSWGTSSLPTSTQQPYLMNNQFQSQHPLLSGSSGGFL